ncbi:uncharacterized protein LOC124542327 [Vanessa cardui]|uniref:uncharacterized protein LOC124542327 n=1 Tax=Vanessa cardui TaxID=171605 RepID=UPI001F147653|nr:uncharacterized protein LOC124542327 [Vanessa cardui]
MNSSRWISVLYGSASILSGIAARIVKLTDIIAINKQNDTINEILFYGSENEEQNKKVGLNNLFCIYYIIIHASKTVDVCVPTLRSETISKCLLNVHQKNHTKVRIIVHSSNDLKSLQSFIDCGIEVKVINSDIKMEHEFLLIDANCHDALAIVGSLDYEVNRVNCSRDNTLLTSEDAVVSVLKREFNRIWNCNENIQNVNSHNKIKTI